MGIHDGVVRSRAQRGGDSYPGEAQNSDCEDRERPMIRLRMKVSVLNCCSSPHSRCVLEEPPGKTMKVP